MKEKKKKEKKNTLPILCMVGPTSLWLLFFLLIPLIYVVVISFMTKGAYGGVVGKFSIDSYKKIFDPLYLTVMWKSVVMAFETSVICLIISYPFAYMLCKVPDKIRGMLTLLIMLPFWVNGLIRLNGWSNILRDSGFVNTLLMKIGIIDQPIQMMYSEGAVLFGMVYTFFPFMVLPLTSSKKDKNIYQSHTPDDAPGNICRNDTGIHTEPWSILHIGCHGRRQRGISWQSDTEPVPCGT